MRRIPGGPTRGTKEYSKKYYDAHVAKYGVSPSVRWRRLHPEGMRRHREKEKQRRLTDPSVRQKQAIRGVKTRELIKLQIMLMYGDGKCACCRESNIKFLTLDHVNNDGAAHRRKTGLKNGIGFYSWLLARGCPNDPPLQVLCYNCNCGKWANKGVCPHKTL